MLKVAWESEGARDRSIRGRSGWVYRDRPVAKPEWEKVRDHPVDGLAVFRVPRSTNE